MEIVDNVPKAVRQAVVMVHGMAEQRPLDMLNKFIKAAVVRERHRGYRAKG